LNQQDLAERLSNTKELYCSFSDLPEFTLKIQDVLNLQVESDDIPAIVRTAQLRNKQFSSQEKLKTALKYLQTYACDWCSLHCPEVAENEVFTYCYDHAQDFRELYDEIASSLEERTRIVKLLESKYLPLMPTDKAARENWMVAFDTEKVHQFLNYVTSENLDDEWFEQRRNIQQMLNYLGTFGQIESAAKSHWAHCKGQASLWTNYAKQEKFQRSLARETRALEVVEIYQNLEKESLRALKRCRETSFKLDKKFFDLQMEMAATEQERESLRANWEEYIKNRGFLDDLMGPTKEQLDFANS